jgi:hypothetical protein
MRVKQLSVIVPHTNEYPAIKSYLKILALWAGEEGIMLEKKILPSSLMRGWSVRKEMGTELGQAKTAQDLMNNWTIYFVLTAEDILLRSNAILGTLERHPDACILELHASMAGKLMAGYAQPGPKPPEERLIWLNKSQLFAIEDPVSALLSALEKFMKNYNDHCNGIFASKIAAIRGYNLENLLCGAKEGLAKLVPHKDSFISVEVPGLPSLLTGKGSASTFYRDVIRRIDWGQTQIENYCSPFEFQYSSHLLCPMEIQKNDLVSLLLYVKHKME